MCSDWSSTAATSARRWYAISDVIELGPTVKHRSVSQLTTYAQCGESYRLSKVAKAPERPTAWSIHGSAVHYGIEEYELSGRTVTAEQAQELALDYYDKGISEQLEENPDYARWLTGGNKKGETDIADRRKLVSDQTKIYIDYAEAHSDEWRVWPVGPKGMACELEFTIDIGGVKVLGYIDQIREYRDGRIAPIDIKTGTKDPGSAMQLGVYAKAIEENMGVRPESGAFFFPRIQRNGTLKGEVWHDLTLWTDDLLATEFSNFDKAERAGIYIASPSDFCRVCSQQDNCRVKGIPGVKERYAEITERPQRAS